MTKILVVHGLGMNMRGKVLLERFGPMTLDDYDRKIVEFASELGVEVETFSSNVEGEVINKLYEAHGGGFDAAVINPAGYMRGYPGLADAIRQVGFPTVEVHYTNPAVRGVISEVGQACSAVVTGFGLFGYYLAMRGALGLASGTAEV